MTRERRKAEHRLRRFEEAVRMRLALEGAPLLDHQVIPDADRLAAPLLERLGVRGRVRLVLWTTMTIVFAIALVSFFSAPLMDADLAVSAALVGTMLTVSYWV
jgi:hypothetical protein